MLLACLAAFAGPGVIHAQEGVVEIRYGVVDPPVVAQRDVTIRHPMSIHPLDPQEKPLEASGVAWAGRRLIITSDRHSHVLFTASVDLDGGSVEIGLPEPRQVVLSEKHLLRDLEAVAVRAASPDGPAFAYALGSLSNEGTGQRSEKRQHIARVPLDDDHEVMINRAVVLPGDAIRDALDEHFDALRVRPYASFNIEMNQNTPRWGNVEGATWTPDGQTLLCGLRNPLADDDALLFALAGVDEAFDAEDPGVLRVTDLMRLPLGGRGVSDLAWDPVTRGYLITAALSNGPKLDDGSAYPLEDLQSALFWWSGQKEDAPRQIASFADLNADGVCRIAESPYLLIASDEGDVSEERRGRQSVLTVMYFTGWAGSGAP